MRSLMSSFGNGGLLIIIYCISPFSSALLIGIIPIPIININIVKAIAFLTIEPVMFHSLQLISYNKKYRCSFKCYGYNIILIIWKTKILIIFI